MEEEQEKEEYVKVSEARRRTGAALSTIYASINSGGVKTQTLGKVKHVEIQSLKDYLLTVPSDLEEDHKELRDALGFVSDYAKKSLSLVVEPHQALLKLFQGMIDSLQRQVVEKDKLISDLVAQSSEASLRKFEIEQTAASEALRMQSTDDRIKRFGEIIVPLLSYFGAKGEARKAVLALSEEQLSAFVEVMREDGNEDGADAFLEFARSIRDAKKGVE